MYRTSPCMAERHDGCVQGVTPHGVWPTCDCRCHRPAEPEPVRPERIPLSNDYVPVTGNVASYVDMFVTPDMDEHDINILITEARHHYL